MYAYVKKNREERRAEMNQFLHDHTSHSLEAVTVIISVSKSCPGCCYNLKDILVLPGPSSWVLDIHYWLIESIMNLTHINDSLAFW